MTDKAKFKAFEIVWNGLPECIGVYAAESSAKAKYMCALAVVDAGYARKTGEVFKGVKCRRRTDCDKWAEQFEKPTSWAIERVKLHALS